MAFCDVDETYAANSYKAHPKVPRYTDYRKMFDELERKIDAVVVATPDHHHYPASMMALQRGKHVYCEKPLTYTIEQARLLAKAAREKKLATQMGNQGNSSESTRLIREWIKAGVLGEVREIHHWNDYPMAAREPRQPAAIPPGVDWDLWLGPVPARPFTTGTIRMGWHPFSDICNGLIGNWGTHHISGAWWALDLGAPQHDRSRRADRVAGEGVVSAGLRPEVHLPGPRRPAGSGHVLPRRHEGRRDAPPQAPRAGTEADEAMGGPKGQVIVGTEASIMAGPWCDGARIIPEKKMQEVGRVPQTLEGYGEPPQLAPGLQGRHADGLELRFRGARHGGRPAGQHRPAARQEAGVGRREDVLPQRARGRQVPPRRTAQGMGVCSMDVHAVAYRAGFPASPKGSLKARLQQPYHGRERT